MANGLGALYGLKALGGTAQAIYGFHQAGLAREREAALRKAGMPQMATAQEYFDLYQNASRSKQFEQEKAMTQSILASNLATLQAAGSRAVLGGAGAAQLTAQRGIAQAAQADYARQQDALAQLAAAQQQTNFLNFQARTKQYSDDLIAAREGYTAGIETAVSGLGTAMEGGLGFVENRKKKGGDDDKTKTDSTLDQPTVNTDAYRMPTIGSGEGMDFLKQKRIDEELDASAARFGSGTFAKGGSVTTPGKYTADHSVEYDVKTKGGKTIATVTGDETLVFNPSQRRFLKKIIGRLLSGKNIQLGKNETKTAKQTLKAFKK